MNTTKFRRLQLAQWRQFKHVNVEFSSGVTILTGRNGTGKTSLLNTLAQHTPFKSDFLGSPVQMRDGRGQFTSGFWDWYLATEKYTKVGSVDYDNDQTVDIMVPTEVGRNVTLRLSGQVPISVLYIPSNRQLPNSKPVEYIPTDPIDSSAALKGYQDEFWKSRKGEYSRDNPLLKMKEAIISMAAFGPGNDRIVGNEASYSALIEFERRLREIIPASIGFKKLQVSIPDVILETSSGNFLLDAASSGLMSLMSITWEVTLFARTSSAFVVLIDEPENHLHPSMQREFLPALVRAFPEAQFIVATHSPFVVSSVRDSRIYAFDIEDAPIDRRIASDLSSAHNAVVAVEVEPRNRAQASQVLSQVLGVPVSIPVWVEEELDSVFADVQSGDFTAAKLHELKAALDARGLSEFLPELVTKVLANNA